MDPLGNSLRAAFLFIPSLTTAAVAAVTAFAVASVGHLLASRSFIRSATLFLRCLSVRPSGCQRAGRGRPLHHVPAAAALSCFSLSSRLGAFASSSSSFLVPPKRPVFGEMGGKAKVEKVAAGTAEAALSKEVYKHEAMIRTLWAKQRGLTNPLLFPAVLACSLR